MKSKLIRMMFRPSSFCFVLILTLLGCRNDEQGNTKDAELPVDLLNQLSFPSDKFKSKRTIDPVFDRKRDSLNVLYVGNSYLSYRPIVKDERAPLSVYHQFNRMLEESGITVKNTRFSIGGGTLKEHWETGNGSETARGKIESEAFDLLVIQGRYDIHREAKFEARFDSYFDKFAELAKRHKVETVLFGLWATDKQISPNNDSFGPKAHEIYQRAALRNTVFYSPTGLGYSTMYEYLSKSFAESQIETFLTDDQIHPSPTLAYLAASMLFTRVVGFSAEGGDQFSPEEVNPKISEIARMISLWAIAEFGH